MLLPSVMHGSGPRARQDHGGDARPPALQADSAAQAVAPERDALEAGGLAMIEDGLQILDLLGRGQRIVVAFAAAAEIEGKRAVAGAGEAAGDIVETAFRGFVAGEAMGQNDQSLRISRDEARRPSAGRACWRSRAAARTQSAASTFSTVPSMPTTLTCRPAGSSGPAARQTLSSTLMLPRPLMMGVSSVKRRPR